jgi:ABC-type Fe3+ transport system permease subunit
VFVVFTLVITDFGVPKVIGGQFNVLATDIYKQVVGQQNFQMGAVVGLILLLPAVIAFAVGQVMQRRQSALLSSRAVPYTPKPDPRIDRLMLAICSLIAAVILVMLAVAFFASLATFWPYSKSFKSCPSPSTASFAASSGPAAAAGAASEARGSANKARQPLSVAPPKSTKAPSAAGGKIAEPRRLTSRRAASVSSTP